jgi:hypothetical protein
MQFIVQFGPTSHFALPHCTSAVINMTRVISIFFLGPHTVMDLRAAAKPTEFYPLPACRTSLRDGTGYITIHEKRALTNELPEYDIQAYFQKRNNWTAHIYDCMSWDAYRLLFSILTDNAKTFVIKLSHDWLPVGIRRCVATTDIRPQCTQSESVCHLYLYHSRTTWRDQFITQQQQQQHRFDTFTAAELRCVTLHRLQYTYKSFALKMKRPA